MDSVLLTPIDPDLPGLLRQLHEQLSTGGVAALRGDTLQAVGAARSISPAALAGAVAIGGVDLAQVLLAAAAPQAAPAQRVEALRLALSGLLDGPSGAEPTARWLIDGLGLSDAPDALPDRLRAEFLIAHGPAEQLAEAVQVALRQRRWAAALHGLQRLRATATAQFPRQGYGLASVCLHHLGRFEEANAWVHEGLGADAARVALPPLRSESELLQRWGARAGTPVVSVLCLTFNHERYVDMVMQGFLSQDCDHPFEIIVHDDASTDRTAERIRAWQQRYPRVIRTLLQTENQMSQDGHRPFNLALAAARGEFIAYCEGDDYWIDARKLQRQVDVLIANPALSCCAHNYQLLHEAGVVVRPWSTGTRDFELSPQQLRGVDMLVWLLTLVFRRRFEVLPPENALSAVGDQFLVSYLGSFGACAYLDSMVGAVRRVNEFSTWMPLPDAEKEVRRVKTWAAILRLHQRLGHADAVAAMQRKIDGARLDAPTRQALLDATRLHATPA
jgi:glycosyltransferase involved in cell wall biosynthesis